MAAGSEEALLGLLAALPPTRVHRPSGLAAAIRAARSYDEEDPPPVTRHLWRRRS